MQDSRDEWCHLATILHRTLRYFTNINTAHNLITFSHLSLPVWSMMTYCIQTTEVLTALTFIFYTG